MLVLLIALPGSLAYAADPPDRTAGDTTTDLIPLRLILAWQPQAEFAGYYVALDRGFYRARGIELRILSAGSERSSLAALASGEADLAILWLATAIKARIASIPLVNVAQLFPHSSVVLVVRSESGIQHLDDLSGRRLGIWRGGAGMPVEALLRERQLAVKRIPQSATVNLFLRGGLDAMSAMFYNEYHLLLNAGLEPEDLRVFRLADYGIDLPEDGLYVLEERWRRQPELIESFVAATRRGWEAAFADPESAVDLVLQHQRAGRVPANRLHERWMLEQIRAVMGEPGAAGWNWCLSRNQLEQVAQALHRLGLIEDISGGLDQLRGCR